MNRCCECNRSKVRYELEIEEKTYYFCDEDCSEKWILRLHDERLSEVSDYGKEEER